MATNMPHYFDFVALLASAVQERLPNKTASL